MRLIGLVLMFAAGMAHTPGAWAAEPTRATDKRAASTQTGLASYYARNTHGKETASGETHDNTELVAAHPTLPFGTRVRVTNLENDRSVVVRITDRGPSRQNRQEGVIIDVSRAAADRLDMKEDGRVKVRMEVLASKR